MPVEAPVADKPLSETEQREMDETARNRSTYNNIAPEKYTKNRSRYERWFSKRKGFRLHITKTRRVEGDIPGEWELKPGLSIKFRGGELILDKKDPDYPLIHKKLMEHHYYTLKHLVCVDELEAEEKKRLTPSNIGVNKRHQLRKIGFMDDKKAEQIMSIMGVKSQKEVAALTKKAKALEEENKALKDSDAPQRVKDLEAENKRLREEADARRDERRNRSGSDLGSGAANGVRGLGGNPEGSPEGK